MEGREQPQLQVQGHQERVAHCEITSLPNVMEIPEASVARDNSELKVL